MNTIKLRRSLVLGLVVAVLGACDTPAEENDHVDIEPSGLIIRNSTGAELARATRVSGTVIVSGNVTVAQGAELAGLRLIFLNDLNAPVVLPDSTQYHVRVNSFRASTASWTPETPQSYRGTVTGVAEGATTFGITLFHGPPAGGHPSGLGFNIPVIVTAPTQ